MILQLGDPMSLCHPVARAPNQEILNIGGVTLLIRTWHDLFIHAMTYSYILHHSFICDMNHSHVWHDSPAARAPNKDTEYLRRDMTHLYATWLIYMWHNSFTCATWLTRIPHAESSVTCQIYTWHGVFVYDTSHFTHDTTHSHLWNDSFTCETWLVHVCLHTQCVTARTVSHVTQKGNATHK